ncbi:MAG: hypothetical protein WB992_02295 [Bryobacteraceae bacterium]
MNDPDIRVIPQTRSTFLAGLALYNARPDTNHSVVNDQTDRSAPTRLSVSLILECLSNGTTGEEIGNPDGSTESGYTGRPSFSRTATLGPSCHE